MLVSLSQVLLDFLSLMHQRKQEALDQARRELAMLSEDTQAIKDMLVQVKDAKRPRRSLPGDGSTDGGPNGSRFAPPSTGPGGVLPTCAHSLLVDSGLRGTENAIQSPTVDKMQTPPSGNPTTRRLPLRRPTSSAFQSAAAAAAELAELEAAATRSWGRVSHAYTHLERAFFERRHLAMMDSDQTCKDPHEPGPELHQEGPTAVASSLKTAAFTQISSCSVGGLDGIAPSSSHSSSVPPSPMHINSQPPPQLASDEAPMLVPSLLPGNSPVEPDASAVATQRALPDHLRAFSDDLQQFSMYSRLDGIAALQYGEVLGSCNMVSQLAWQPR